MSYTATTFRERELTRDHIRTSFTTQGHGGPPRMRYQLNAGTTSETTRTWKTIHTIHAPIHSNKANMKGWLWRPNAILGPCGPKASRRLSYRWGSTPKITSHRKLFPIVDRTRSRCVTGGHATVCATAMDFLQNLKILINDISSTMTLILFTKTSVSRVLKITKIGMLTFRTKKYFYYAENSKNYII